ncbi:MAG: hypothetical protein JNJ45_12605 [Chthonomonas sp.]|nr:hypothetical protein [Chthonomonas sp.]
MSAARKYEDQPEPAPRRTAKSAARPTPKRKPAVRKKAVKSTVNPAWKAPFVTFLIAWMFASVAAFSFVEISRRETKHWRAVEEGAERDIRAMQASMQDEYFRRMDQHASAMGLIPPAIAEVPETVVVASNAQPTVKPR